MQFKAERVKLASALSVMNEMMSQSNRQDAYRVAVVVSGCKRRPPTATVHHQTQQSTHRMSIKVSDTTPLTVKRRQSVVQPDLRLSSEKPAVAAAAAAFAAAGAAAANGYQRDAMHRRRRSSVTAPHVPGSIRRPSMTSSNVEISATVAERKRERTGRTSDRKPAADIGDSGDSLADSADNWAVRQQLQTAANAKINVISVGKYIGLHILPYSHLSLPCILLKYETKRKI
jgi:hypothetical protein